VAVEGSKVAIAWGTCTGMHVRVSNDHGDTFVQRGTFGAVDCDAKFGPAVATSLDIQDGRIVLSSPGYIDTVVDRGAFVTANDFATVEGPLRNVGATVGFVRYDGARKLADLSYHLSSGRVVRYRRQH
jgi:hypothetical protein